MKIGDKVRFLSESGGGRIAGFKGNNLVLVEDQDGFEIPMPINEVVVVGDEDYSTKRMVEVEQRNRAQEKAKEDKRSLRQRLQRGTDDARRGPRSGCGDGDGQGPGGRRSLHQLRAATSGATRRRQTDGLSRLRTNGQAKLQYDAL